MNIRIITVGKPGRNAMSGFVEEYAKRLGALWPTDVVSVPEERQTNGKSRTETLRREADRIRSKIPAGSQSIALDRRGKSISSPEFAERLRTWRDDGCRGVTFLIGGPLGLDPALSAEAGLRLSFGPMTFPHDLALIMLTEQIYRAMTIVQGHPYHR